MVTIESTPEMAAKVFETMERNLAIVRRRLNRPLTLADKVLLGHLDDPAHQDLVAGHSYLSLRPDRVVFQDVLGQTGMLQFMQTRRTRVAVPTTIHCDHLIQARNEGVRDLRESLAENTEVYDFLRAAAGLRLQPVVPPAHDQALVGDKTLAFVFFDATNLPDKKAMYMLDATFTFVDADHLTAEWTHYNEGKDAGKVVMNLERAK